MVIPNFKRVAQTVSMSYWRHIEPSHVVYVFSLERTTEQMIMRTKQKDREVLLFTFNLIGAPIRLATTSPQAVKIKDK
jgi:hypothetical protein